MKKMIGKINKLFFIKKMFEGGSEKFDLAFVGNTEAILIKAIITIYAAKELGKAEWYFSYALLGGFFFFIKNTGLIPFLPRSSKNQKKNINTFLRLFNGDRSSIITAFLIIFIAPLFSKMANVRRLRG